MLESTIIGLITHPLVQYLQEKQLRELESKKHVKVSLEKGKGKIRILGFAENVQEASEQVHM